MQFLVNNLANAIKATGVVVEVSAEAFMTFLQQGDNSLVVHAPSGIFRISSKYLTSYKGLAFYAKVSDPLEFSSNVELIEARKMTLLDM